MGPTTVCYRVQALQTTASSKVCQQPTTAQTDGRTAAAAYLQVLQANQRVNSWCACCVYRLARQLIVEALHTGINAGARHREWVTEARAHMRCVRQTHGAAQLPAAMMQRRDGCHAMRKAVAPHSVVHKQPNWQTAQQTLPAAHRPAVCNPCQPTS